MKYEVLEGIVCGGCESKFEIPYGHPRLCDVCWTLSSFPEIKMGTELFKDGYQKATERSSRGKFKSKPRQTDRVESNFKSSRMGGHSAKK